MATIFTNADAPDITGLPWDLPLQEWPAQVLAVLPRGISRHVVRFALVDDIILAVKETDEHTARAEYLLLDRLRSRNLPCVEPAALVTDRSTGDGAPLRACLVTRQLRFSLPYRALFSAALTARTLLPAIDAMAVLLVRLHLAGLYWGDVSLSNVLFRRDAGAFAAYLVDAETGVLREGLSKGQRNQDLEIARLNVAGEILDLAAGQRLGTKVDPALASQAIVDRYTELWEAVTAPESFGPGEMWRVQARIARLNDLGFDVDDVEIKATEDDATVVIRPTVVEAGHHTRRLHRLTGLDVEDNQARRLLNDLDQFVAYTRTPEESEHEAALRWMRESYLPVLSAVPPELRLKLPPPELFHEVLEHRWYLSERQRRDVPMVEVLESYFRDILPLKPDEATILGADPG